MKKSTLTEQLFVICIIILGIMIVSLGIILPKMLIPVYETNVYNYLRQPFSFFLTEDDINSTTINTEVAYLYISSEDIINYSDNLNEVIKVKNIDELLSHLNFSKENGKFKYKYHDYYYVTKTTNDKIRVAITNDSYINQMKQSILLIIFEVVGLSFVIISAFIIIWSNHLVGRIIRIKHKIDNINNENYNFDVDTRYEDELYTLDRAVGDMHNYLREQEEYKNQMYQNISHDFKTPITVMKSYIEAEEDGIEERNNVTKVLKEQLNKLEIKVHSLLYLNKLNYFQDRKEMLKETFDVSVAINAAVQKFKVTRPDVDFIVNIDKKNTTFRGSADMWEAIIDNILNNFMRYAKKTVKITVKKQKIILYNDGENIDENVLNNIFTPYEKGLKGVFGLGLSIVKKTLHLLNYDITIENIKNGVKFTINEGEK